MMTVQKLEEQLNILKNELSECVRSNDYSDVARILTGMSAIKDTLLECYRDAYTKNIASSIKGSHVNIIKYSPTDFSAPLSIVK